MSGPPGFAAPMFPLESVLLPGDDLPLQVFEDRYVAMITDCLAGDGTFGVVLISAGREVGGDDVRCDVGALAHIAECREFGFGRYRLRAMMGERIRVRHWRDDAPYPRAEVELWPDEPGPEVPATAVTDVEDRIYALYERIAAARGARLRPRDGIFGDAGGTGDGAGGGGMGRWLYHLASHVPMGQADRYAVLAAPTPADRLAALSEAVDGVSAVVEFQLGQSPPE